MTRRQRALRCAIYRGAFSGIAFFTVLIGALGAVDWIAG